MHLDPPRSGIRIRGWLDFVEARGGRSYRRRRRQPSQGRVRGTDIRVQCAATYSPYEAQTRGTSRAYLERSDASPLVVQQVPFEDYLDRWGIWIRPSEPHADEHVVLSVLQEFLESRYGIDPQDVYLTRHSSVDKHGNMHDHYHAVVPAWVIENEDTGEARKVEITREDMTAFAKELARELVLERQLNRTLAASEDGGEAGGSVGGHWNDPPTDKQMDILRAHGRAARDITRGEASLVIEEIIGERSWYGGRDR
jgi:hypothetical protein